MDTVTATATGAEPNPDAVSAALGATNGATGFAKRRNRGNTNARKRVEEEVDAGEDDSEAGLQRRAAKAPRGEPVAFSTRRATGEAGAEGEGIKDIRFTYDSNRGIQQTHDARVTGQIETETETDHDARALRERVLRQGQEGGAVVDDKTYKGMTGYVDYRQGFRREHTIGAEKGGGAHGPLRGSMFARVTAIMDYNPSLCKDYKETGYCSFGDSCKFMHDRGDYKSGWELEKQYEAEVKEKQAAAIRAWAADNDDGGEGGEAGTSGGGGGADAEEEDDGLPFACYICRKPWPECSMPVITRCRHYFCEACALKHNRSVGKCAACEQPTQGIFNVAHDIVKKFQLKH